MTTTNLLTEQITLAGLRQQAERLKIPDFAKLRKQELIKAISDALAEQNIEVIDRITGKASTKSLTGSGADLHSKTDQVNNWQE